MPTQKKMPNNIIESLHLVNFEVHADTLIEFDPGINVIKGSTDQGKSTIRRALTYAAFSRPVQGRAKNKKKDSFVAIRCTGAPTITRGRVGGKKGKNYYKIDSKELTGGSTGSLKAFKREVPEEVSRILDLSEVNIQEQFKEYYLLQSTAGQVAKTIHKLLGMDLVDKTSKIANSAITAQAKLLESRRIQLKNIKVDIKEYDYIEGLETELEDLELAIQNYEELEARTHNLTALLERCKILKQKIEASSVPDIVEERARLLLVKISETDEQQVKFDKLHQAIKAVDKVAAKQRELKEWMQVEDEAIELQKEITGLQTLGVRSQRLGELVTQLDGINSQTANVRKVIEYNTSKLAAMKKELKVCPVCEKPF